MTPSFTGALLWPFLYPWPQRPAGLVEEGFKELAKRWKPILDYADKHGVDIAYELHPGEDLHDGLTFELFLEATGNHPRVAINYDPSHFILQCLDYVGFIDVYGAAHQGLPREGRRVPPFGQSGRLRRLRRLDSSARAASARSATARWTSSRSSPASPPPATRSWAVLEWECCFKDAAQGAAEGAPFIQSISSTCRRRRSTTSPARPPTPGGTAGFWAWPDSRRQPRNSLQLGAWNRASALFFCRRAQV